MVLRVLLAVLACSLAAPARADEWPAAHKKGPLTAKETRAFMKALLKYVEDNHLKTDPKSAQRGMVYEYFDVRRKGRFDQWVQGEALDTMHDGAWLAAALVTAHRATADRAYRDFVTRWQLPFYCKMLNGSDRLFSAKRNDARPKAHRFNKEHALQEGEKGFVPYWWDDGASVSLERRRDKGALGVFACADLLAGKPNPRFLLSGWSHGSSNHLAQDLGVMLMTAWLMLRDSKDDAALARQVAEAAKNLHACRLRHHGTIPMCLAPAALASADAKLVKRLPDGSTAATWQPNNHTWRALYDFKPRQRYAFPGFADDQQYRYYTALARHGGKLPDAAAFRVVYDALTEPQLYKLYCDDEQAPPGINRFDLHPYYAKDGRPEDYRSDRKGPHKRPRPIGSRMGPQNMVCAGWAIQLLGERKGLWEKRYSRDFAKDARVYLYDPELLGKEAKPWSEKVAVGALTLRLVATGAGLELRGETKAGRVELELSARPDGKGASARVSFGATGEVKVVNDRGQKLRAKVTRTVRDGGLAFSASLPWTAAKDQTGVWANGVEHGRYSARSGKATRNLYLASTEASVTKRLRRELGEGLRTWRALFDEKKYIPTGLGAGDWDHFSDSGGYAHLIAAAAQWLLVLDGKKDWELHEVPVVIPGAK